MNVNESNRAGDGPADLDVYLARCVAACVRGTDPPRWPAAIEPESKIACQRVAFHGIALLLVECPGTLQSWPPAIAEEVREEARRQSFWETSHRLAISGLLDAFAAAGVEAVVTKGTALAYSVYDQPALRRRGDSDIVIVSGARAVVRQALRGCGFVPCDDVRALQESWEKPAPPNFVHQIDLHWRINASPAISQRIESTRPFSRTTPIARLSPAARGLAPIDNLVLTCINRTLHQKHGYKYGCATVFEPDRLIWAVDIDLIARALAPAQWDDLTDLALTSGTSVSLASGLAFAQRVCGTDIPTAILRHLNAAEKPDEITAVLGGGSALRRLQVDLAASASWTEWTRILRYTLLPSPQFLRERFPQSAHWPPTLLIARRLAVGLGKLLRVTG